MDVPIIIINGCEEHCTVGGGRIRAVMSGPDSTETARDFIADPLQCWKCWELDEPAMLLATAAFHLTPEETVMLRRSVLRRKIEANRN